MNIEDVKAKYLVSHNNLGKRKDATDKKLFDQQHRQIWSDCDAELKAKFSKSELLRLE